MGGDALDVGARVFAGRRGRRRRRVQPLALGQLVRVLLDGPVLRDARGLLLLRRPSGLSGLHERGGGGGGG